MVIYRREGKLFWTIGKKYSPNLIYFERSEQQEIV
jgi:hypothetical protein